MTELSEYQQAVEANTEGLIAVSTGICPGCEQCRDEGEVKFKSFFSYRGCGICGTRLGQSFEVWHAIDSEGEIIHGERACIDCICYLANGDHPENWRRN